MCKITKSRLKAREGIRNKFNHYVSPSKYKDLLDKSVPLKDWTATIERNAVTAKLAKVGIKKDKRQHNTRYTGGYECRKKILFCTPRDILKIIKFDEDKYIETSSSTYLTNVQLYKEKFKRICAFVQTQGE